MSDRPGTARNQMISTPVPPQTPRLRRIRNRRSDRTRGLPILPRRAEPPHASRPWPARPGATERDRDEPGRAALWPAAGRCRLARRRELSGISRPAQGAGPAAFTGRVLRDVPRLPPVARRREPDAARRSGCCRQLQGLRAGIRRVHGDDDAGALELGGEMLVQAIAAIVKAFERRLAADGRQPGARHRRYGPSLAVQRALQGYDDLLAGVRIRFGCPAPASPSRTRASHCRVLKPPQVPRNAVPVSRQWPIAA
jgi:hypothetical protein